MTRPLPVIDINERTSVHRWPNNTPERRPMPTKDNPIIVSASEIRDFLRCRQKWAWRHQHRLMPVGGSEALDTGTLIHLILEHWYALPVAKRTVRAMEKIAQKQTRTSTLEALTEDGRQLIQAMTIGYAAWAKDEDPIIGLETCVPEMAFTLPLTASKLIWIRGKIDTTFRAVNERKVYGCLETKSKSRVQLDIVDTNFQLSTYLWAMRQLQPKMRRYVAYYQILRKQMPTARVRSDLFYREAVERTDDEIMQWALDVEQIAMEMLNPPVYPSPQDSCSWECDFKMPCLLRGAPEDVQHVLSTEYKLKERR